MLGAGGRRACEPGNWGMEQADICRVGFPDFECTGHWTDRAALWITSRPVPYAIAELLRASQLAGDACVLLRDCAADWSVAVSFGLAKSQAGAASVLRSSLLPCGSGRMGYVATNRISCADGCSCLRRICGAGNRLDNDDDGCVLEHPPWTRDSASRVDDSQLRRHCRSNHTSLLPANNDGAEGSA
jgi:hypothetical protein